ncbi:MAG: hypothetical protein KFBDDELM_00105 [Candidatus Argoarchaeum ethanivorans]|uniref:Uncharacterized protein n=1 Tax=Candidatus Argoarchaeum ethanivorans TaxID=2608793 RepID=A0A811T3I4_9EURY|nr:MAG: hypothetical protein KFBDDELM_00105 [Candidatus Argoarchaeum ethanivorans]
MVNKFGLKVLVVLTVLATVASSTARYCSRDAKKKLSECGGNNGYNIISGSHK